MLWYLSNKYQHITDLTFYIPKWIILFPTDGPNKQKVYIFHKYNTVIRYRYFLLKNNFLVLIFTITIRDLTFARLKIRFTKALRHGNHVCRKCSIEMQKELHNNCSCIILMRDPKVFIRYGSVSDLF